MTMLRALKIAKAARVLKVLRALKLGGLMQAVEEQMVTAESSMTVAFQLTKMCIVMVLIAHWIACTWFAVGFWGQHLGYDNTWVLTHELLGVSHYDQWVTSFYFAITTGTTVGYGDIAATNVLERFVGSLLLLALVMFIGQFIARVNQVVSSLQQGEADKMRIKREAMLFMKRRSVSKSLYQKVLRYLEHVYETDSFTSFSAVQFVEMLSQSLQAELRHEIIGYFIRKFPLFADAGDAFVKALCLACRTLRAGKGDIVGQQGQANENMYMIVQGEVMFNRNNKKLGLLFREDWFGEQALFFEGLIHNVTMKCETECEFLVISRPEFLRQVGQFPVVQQEFDTLLNALWSQKDPSLRPRVPDLRYPDLNSPSVVGKPWDR